MVGVQPQDHTGAFAVEGWLKTPAFPGNQCMFEAMIQPILLLERVNLACGPVVKERATPTPPCFRVQQISSHAYLHLLCLKFRALLSIFASVAAHRTRSLPGDRLGYGTWGSRAREKAGSCFSKWIAHVGLRISITYGHIGGPGDFHTSIGISHHPTYPYFSV